ncbi:CPCC family cysteine-rich protein [Gimesia sp.]|uniref:CPCC family cysteine-rich protein n=1 Tax=Gimesia sp. TaxID=2024833 RepID=UPI003A95D01E
MNYPCPACGYEVFEEPPGSYDICGVCGWEDDHVQLRYPCMRGGANKQSLWEWQQMVLPTLSTEVGSGPDLQRCPDWRPLEEKDCQDINNSPKSGVEYFESAASKNPPYYWRRS